MPSNRKSYRWFYDNIACRYYNAMMKWCCLPFGGETKVRRRLIDAAPPRRGEKILDICCGTGGATFVIAERAGDGSTIIGADLSAGQVRVARKTNRFPNISFVVSDASNAAFSEGEFDRVMIPHAIHEMPRPARLAVLAEARRVLREGGTLIILDMDSPPGLSMRLLIGFFWFYWLPFNFETPTRRDMLRHGLIEEVKEAGLRGVVKSSFYGGAFQVVQGQK